MYSHAMHNYNHTCTVHSQRDVARVIKVQKYLFVFRLQWQRRKQTGDFPEVQKWINELTTR